jgi:hypothetical protein
MLALIILGFVAALAIIAWTAMIVLIDGRAGSLGRVIYILMTAVITVLAFWSTFWIVYFSGPNTRIEGWPVPTIIFQRDDANSPWLDYIGPTLLLGLPMNWILFMFVPSLAFLGISYLPFRRDNDMLAAPQSDAAPPTNR